LSSSAALAMVRQWPHRPRRQRYAIGSSAAVAMVRQWPRRPWYANGVVGRLQRPRYTIGLAGYGSPLDSSAAPAMVRQWSRRPRRPWYAIGLVVGWPRWPRYAIGLMGRGGPVRHWTRHGVASRGQWRIVAGTAYDDANGGSHTETTTPPSSSSAAGRDTTESTFGVVHQEAASPESDGQSGGRPRPAKP
jgi:hypothetical protein